MQLRLNIVFLRIRNALHIDVPELERWQTLPIGFAALCQLFLFDFPGHALLDGIHHLHRPAVADFHQLLRPVEIEQGNVVEPKPKCHPFFFRNFHLRILHNHGLDLIVPVVRRLFLAARKVRAEDEIRVERLAHGLDREIIIDSAVEKRHFVFPYRFEEQRKGHRDAHGIAQVAVAEYDRFLIVHIRPHAAERDEQIIKVPSCLGRRLSIKPHERLVHLYRVYQTLWQEVGFDMQRVGHLDGDLEKFRRRVWFMEIVHIIVLHLPRLPVREVFRED